MILFSFICGIIGTLTYAALYNQIGSPAKVLLFLPALMFLVCLAIRLYLGVRRKTRITETVRRDSVLRQWETTFIPQFLEPAEWIACWILLCPWLDPGPICWTLLDWNVQPSSPSGPRQPSSALQVMNETSHQCSAVQCSAQCFTVWLQADDTFVRQPRGTEGLVPDQGQRPRPPGPASTSASPASVSSTVSPYLPHGIPSIEMLCFMFYSQ